jgi:hypothetical protein
MALAAPSADFATLTLTTVSKSASRLLRVSKYDSGEPHFGRSANNRFDDPDPVAANRFGTCYLAFDAKTAIAETVLHDLMPEAGWFRVAEVELASRYLYRFEDSDLVLVDLTGVPLKRLGGEASISSEVPPKTPQLWAKAIHAHPANVDGILYMSRHLNTKKAVILFDRAASKITAKNYTPMLKARGMKRHLEDLGVVAVR